MNRLAQRLTRLEQDAGAGPPRVPFEPERIIPFVCDAESGAIALAWPVAEALARAIMTEKDAIVALRRARGKRTPYLIVARIVGENVTLQVQDGPYLLDGLSEAEVQALIDLKEDG